MSSSHALVSLIARVLLAIIFIVAGWGKFMDPAGSAGYMQTATFPIPMPDITIYLVAALELLGGLAILLGWCSRWAALALAVFSVLAAVGFHANFADEMQFILFLKNLAMAGGLLLLFANGPGAFSISKD